MSLADEWNEIERRLDPRWSDAHLDLRVPEEAQCNRATALLAPAGPGRLGTSIRFYVARGGTGVGPEAVRRMLRRLDAERIRGTLTLVASGEATRASAAPRSSLANDWTAALTTLPSDWSDLLCELDLRSSDHVERGALLLAPLNPIQVTEGLGFRFRCAHRFGYGASAGMVHRCLERLDADGIPGEVRVLRALSDTNPVGTQGPVWYIGGKAV
jgi:hypothetical protein